MARSFQDVLAEVTAQSDPQKNIVLNQISQLPTQQAADESSLDAKKNQAFDDILGGARQRGLGFSGIPLGEQAKYTATDYAPALANLKSTYGTRQASLESALADIGKSNYATANDIFNQDRAFEEQQRQFNANLAFQRQQAAANSASGNVLSSLFGGSQPAAQQTQQQGPDQVTQRAYNAIQDLLSTKNAGLIQNTYNAIKKSAGYGNAYDKVKLQLIEQLYPTVKNYGKNSVPLGPVNLGNSTVRL